MCNTTTLTRLNDVFPGWLTGGGIFSTLQTFPVPWQDDNISGALDLEYHGNVSGDKIISPLVEKVKTGDTLTVSEKTLLATSIIAICGVNWEKQWESLSFQYNPIENYRMVENMTDDETVTEYGKTSTRTDNLTHHKTGMETLDIDGTETRTDNLTHAKTGTETADIDETDTRTDNLTHGKTGTETRTDNLTDTATPNLTTNTANTIHGFNSSTGVPSGEQVGTETGTNTITHTGTEQRQYNLSETDTGTQTTVKDGTNETTFNTSETNTGTQITGTDATNETTFNTTDTDTGTQSNVEGGSDTSTRNYEMTRSGNIGVTTSQQMIESERALWVWNFFRDVVFPDVDRVLTLQIY